MDRITTIYLSYIPILVNKWIYVVSSYPREVKRSSWVWRVIQEVSRGRWRGYSGSAQGQNILSKRKFFPCSLMLLYLIKERHKSMTCVASVHVDKQSACIVLMWTRCICSAFYSQSNDSLHIDKQSSYIVLMWTRSIRSELCSQSNDSVFSEVWAMSQCHDTISDYWSPCHICLHNQI